MEWITVFITLLFPIFLQSNGSPMIHFRLKSKAPNLELVRHDMSPNYIGRDPETTQAVLDLYKIAPIEPLLRPSIFTPNSCSNKKQPQYRIYLYYKIRPEDFGEKTSKEILEELKKNPLIDMAAEEPRPAPFDEDLTKYVRCKNSIANRASVIHFDNRNVTTKKQSKESGNKYRFLQADYPDYSDCDVNGYLCQRYMIEDTISPTIIGGVNALEAQRLTNHKGEHARIIVAESQLPDWDHIDLPSPEADLHITGTGSLNSHATSSAGVMVGQDNGFGVLGIAAHAKVGDIVFNGYYLEILMSRLIPGDVIQGGVHYETEGEHCDNGSWHPCLVPAEFFDVHRDFFKYLTEEKGVHVIQAAGNGNINLDHPSLKGTISTENDSGSIICGAVNPLDGARADYSGYGSRVTLCAWGSHVTTTSMEANPYTFGYSGTSSANPIIAGCTAFLQSLAIAKGIGPIPPKVLRQIMYDTGTDIPYPDPNYNIGRQPNLVKAVEYLESMVTSSTKMVPEEESSKERKRTKKRRTKTTITTITTAPAAPSTRKGSTKNIIIGASVAGSILVGSVATYTLVKRKSFKPKFVEGAFEDEFI